MALNGPAIGQLQYFNHARLVDVHSTGMLTLLIVGSTATFSGTCTKRVGNGNPGMRSEEHTSELQSQSNLVCRLLLEKKKKKLDKRKIEIAETDAPSEQRDVPQRSALHHATRVLDNTVAQLLPPFNPPPLLPPLPAHP